MEEKTTFLRQFGLICNIISRSSLQPMPNKYYFQGPNNRCAHLNDSMLKFAWITKRLDPIKSSDVIYFEFQIKDAMFI